MDASRLVQLLAAGWRALVLGHLQELADHVPGSPEHRPDHHPGLVLAAEQVEC
jgi:hypothetical protein